MSESVATEEQPKFTTPGVAHWRVLMWLDRTGLPSWQLGLAVFLALTLCGVLSLVMTSERNPSLYLSLVAFVAIVAYFLILYLELARGWYQDYLKILDFDPKMSDADGMLTPSVRTRWVETVLSFIFATINLSLNEVIEKDFDFGHFFAWGIYWLEYLLVFFCVDIFLRQLLTLTHVCDQIRIHLLEADFYAVLANSMLRFLKLYILGLCIVFLSYSVFTADQDFGFGVFMVILMPFYLPGLVMLGLFLMPYNRIKQRIHVAKTIELNHVRRALVKGDRAHLRSSLVGEDADKLTRVDLMYYEERISRIKELPFTDRIRAMLLFGVLPPLTWVIAALIEIFIESLL